LCKPIVLKLPSISCRAFLTYYPCLALKQIECSHNIICADLCATYSIAYPTYSGFLTAKSVHVSHDAIYKPCTSFFRRSARNHFTASRALYLVVRDAFDYLMCPRALLLAVWCC